MSQLKSLMEIVKKYLDALFTKGMYGHNKIVNILEFTCYAKHHLNSCYKIFKTPLNIGFYMLLYLQNVHTITARWLLNQLKLQSRWFIFMIWNSTKKCLRFLSLYEKDGRTPSYLA